MTVATSPTSSAAEAGFPRPFGKYLLVHPLGEGGMGAVFLAKTSNVTGIEKLCVVKTLRPALVADDDYAGRFLDEARLVVQLAHRNICSVFDVGFIDGRYYLAMEHVAGRDLRALLGRLRANSTCLSLGAALHLMTEVLDALDYAHRLRDPRSDDPLRLVHRDVSPQNVMVNFEGEVKLIDFGLAVSTMKDQKTEPQSVMGKIAYMSPEQARGDALDGRADQFAAAIVLFEALTTQRYYGDLTPHQIWGLSGSGDYQPARLATLGEDIVNLLRRALAPDRDKRFPSCAEMREALEAAQLARGVKSGDARRELRQHMQELFDAERLSEKHLLAGLAVMEATGPASPSAPVPVAPEAETSATPSPSPSPSPSSSSSALSPASSSASSSSSSSSDVRTGGEPTPTTFEHNVDDATAMHLRAARLAQRGRSARAVAAGVLAAATLALVVVGLSGAEESTPAPVDAAPTVAPAKSVDEAIEAPVAPTRVDEGKEPVPLPVPATVTPSDASAKKGEVSPREVTKDAKAARPKQQGARPRPSGPRAKRPAEVPTGYTGMLGYVKSWCRAEPCSREVLADDRAMRAKGEPTTEDLLRAVKSLRSCVERCAR